MRVFEPNSQAKKPKKRLFKKNVDVDHQYIQSVKPHQGTKKQIQHTVSPATRSTHRSEKRRDGIDQNDAMKYETAKKSHVSATKYLYQFLADPELIGTNKHWLHGIQNKIYQHHFKNLP